MSEDAGSVSEAFTIVLTGQPANDVTVEITSSDTDKVTDPSVQPLRSSTWNQPQAVELTIRTDDDDTEDDTVTIMMTTTAEAGDEAFNGLTASFTVNISDDDQAGIKLSAGAVTVLEGTTKTNAEADENSAKWTVALNTAPATGTTVKVAITSSNPSAATVNPAELTFDSNNYQTAQDVIVTGEVDDDFLSNMVIFTHAVTEGTYAAASRTVTVTANDTATPSIVLGNVQPATETDPNILFIDEGVTRYVYTVALSHRPTSRVRIAMPNPHADNLTLSTSRLAFEPGGNDWSRPRNIYVDALPDENNENDTYPITHTATGGGYDDVASVLAITVEDSGKPGIKLSRTNLTLNEGAEDSWTVVLNTQPTASVEVVVGVSAGTDNIGVTAGDAGTLTFTTENWDDPQTVTVSGTEDDNVTDGSATVGHSVTSPDTNYNHVNIDNEINRDVSVSVKDNDSARLTLSRTSLDVSEDAGSVSEAFTIVLTGQPANDVTVEITSSDTDKVTDPSVQPLRSSTWNQPQAVELTIRTDDDDTEDDTVTIMMTTTAEAGDEAFNGLTASFTVNISDVNKAGIKLSTDAVTVLEGTTKTNAEADENSAKWTVALNTAPATGTTVKVAITSSNPSAATVNPAELTFDSNNYQTAQDVIVTGEVDDDFLSNMVIFTHAVTEGTYAAASRTVTVTANDTATPSIVLGNVQPATETDPNILFIDEGVTRYVYTVALSHRPTSRVRIAMPNPHADNLTLSTSRLAFEPGGNDWSRPRNIYVDALPDENNENDTYPITHTATGGGYDDVASVLAITVEDSGKPGIKLSRTNLTLDEGAEDSWTVVLNTQPTASVEVVVGVSAGTDNIGVTAGDAGTLTFTTENWDDPQTVTVSGTEDDNVTDGSATVGHSVTSPDTNYNHVNIDNEINRDVSVSVKDNDSARLTLSRTSLDVSEDAGSVSEAFTIVLTGQPANDVTVEITSSDTDKVTDPSVQPLRSSTWNQPQAVELTIRTDDDDTEDDTVTIMMTTTAEAGDEAFNGLTASFTVNISDDDQAGIKLSAGAVTVLEGTTKTNAEADENSAKWTVALNTAPATGTTVKVAITSSNPSAATVNPAELTFDSNNYQTAQDVIVTGEVDDDFLSNMVIFTHAVTEGTYAAASRTVTVTANDTATPSIVLGNVQPATETDPNILFIDEGVTRYVYTVALSHRPTSRVRIAMPNPHADNLTLSTSRLAFEPGGNDWSRPRNIYVDALPDENNENDTYPITHTATGGGYDDVASVLAITVEDSGKPGIKLSRTNLTLNEGAEDSWTVVLNTQPTASVEVVVGVSAGTDNIGVTAGDAGTLTFTTENWDDPQTVTVSGTEDDNVTDGSATVGHSVTSPDTNYNHVNIDNEINRDVSVSVKDNDSARLTLSRTSLDVSEDAGSVSEAFTIVLTGQPANDVTVEITSSDTDKVTDPSVQPLRSSTWNQPQAVELTIRTDDDDTEDDTVTIMMTTTAEAGDEAFNGLTASFTVNISDVNKAGIKLSTDAVTVLEGTTKTNADAADGSATWTVALNTAPATGTTVKVGITSSNPSAATVNPAELTFDSNNSGTGQTVTVTGEVDDDFLNNMVIFTHSVTEGTYAAPSRTVTVTATDTATPSIVLGNVQPATETDPNMLSLEEGTTRYEYTVALSHRPTSMVRIAMPNPDADKLTLSTSRLSLRTRRQRLEQAAYHLRRCH